MCYVRLGYIFVFGLLERDLQRMNDRIPKEQLGKMDGAHSCPGLGSSTGDQK
jgi:hypothetical protein